MTKISEVNQRLLDLPILIQLPERSDRILN